MASSKKKAQVRDIGDLPLKERNRIKKDFKKRMAKERPKAVASLKRKYGNKKEKGGRNR